MNLPTPPPVPGAERTCLELRRKLVIALAVISAGLLAVVFLLRIFGLVRPFSVPTGAMSRAVAPGDHVLMEGLSFLVRQPRRGEIVVFKTKGIESLPQTEIYLKRVAGEPGDQLQISDGHLYINNRYVALSNAAGEIAYLPPPRLPGASLKTDLTVPTGHYFVLGDDSTNSLDSRFWGSLRRENIIGRVVFCYWPPQRAGWVK
jgi:signal peptidase I